MKLKGLFLLSLSLLITSFIFAGVVRAASEGIVAATVTVQNISVSVTDGTVAFGTLANNASAGTNGTDTQTATNDGNITEVFNIKGQVSAGWTLGATAGSNIYVLQFCTATCTTPPTSYTALTTSYQTLAASVTTNDTQTFDLYITTPNPSTVYTEQSVNVTVQATQ